MIVILLLIFGPMILFSALNPMSQINSIKGAHIQIGF
jgi:hypothetical protein